MLTEMETFTKSICAKSSLKDVDRTYVMKGSYADKELETYHLILAPSFRCNIECRHCYLPDHKALALPKERVLHLMDEWSEIVAEERGPFGGIFHLKGGEPLILPYLNDVLDRLEENKTLRFMMTTNGITGSQAVVERLECLSVALDGNVQIIVSIDGSNETINAQLRGPGKFEKAVSFVRMLREADITVYLNNVLHKGNLNDIESFIELAESLDVQQVNFLSFNPKGYGKMMASLKVNPDEVFKHVDAAWKVGDQRRRSLLTGSLSDILHAETRSNCTSPECVGGYRGLLYVIPDGTAHSCPNLNTRRLAAGNIMESALASIHEKIYDLVYEKIRTSGGPVEDYYRCKGLGEKTGLFLSQRSILPEISKELSCRGISNSVSYCFNRNW